MPIRRRIVTAEQRERRDRTKKVYDGHPRPEFQGYVLRFGNIQAEFISAGMIRLDDRAPNMKTRPPATFDFYSRAGVVKLIAQAKRDGFSSRHLQTVLDEWPGQFAELPSHRLNLCTDD